MSAKNIDTLLDLWAATLLEHNDSPPFANHSDLYETIDSTPLGGIPWQSFSLTFTGELPEGEVPEWMCSKYEVWFRDPLMLVKDILANPDYKGQIDYAPVQEFEGSGHRRYWNFMSGDWAWEQADMIAQDPETHGAMFVPIILGSDKTTVSVATGHNEYYPLYASIGNVHNNIRRAHLGALVLVGFLAIPKTDNAHASSAKFRKFRRQLFHSSLSKILESLRPGMTTPEVTNLRLGPYIADYPEQVLLTCIVQGWCPVAARCTAKQTDLDGGGGRRSREHTELLVSGFELGTLWVEYGLVGDVIPFTNDFPRADIHELITPDILHQLIKGTFKDHLVSWVEKYLILEHGQTRAQPILDDIDRRIAAAAPFAGLRRFPQGRGFKQWTGDDSKALMKVYLPAIEGHVPRDAVWAFRAFLEFCYIVRHDVITEETVRDLHDTIMRYHNYRTIFEELGVRPDGFALPRQHSLLHYPSLIRAFGAPNGLCSSITESKHIKALLLTNQRLDKLAAARVDFTNRGMLDGTVLSAKLQTIESYANSIDDGHVDSSTVLTHVELARTVQRRLRPSDLAAEINLPTFPQLIRRFLYDQLYPESHLTSSDVSLSACPTFTGTISLFPSATATFYAPSDPSGVGGMHREHIRATSAWRQGPARYDCVFVNTRPHLNGMRALDVGHVWCFFSFEYHNTTYPCAVVHRYSLIGEECDEDTGMWMVKPEMAYDGSPVVSIIHLDTIFRAAHLLPSFGCARLPRAITCHNSLDGFTAYYVNKFIDHHAFETAS
ncbi:hypothetical protein BJV78DRAFT_1277481 [Lactifluus subvellereus]|nr:hypothetical protein BJV78DRAFT_1277481 [Lactifluus subvellereus]